jgi:hypothetical protein
MIFSEKKQHGFFSLEMAEIEDAGFGDNLLSN